MILRNLTCAAAAALLTSVAPAAAAVGTPSYTTGQSMSGVDAFYASRRNAPLWFSAGAPTAAVASLIQTLNRAPLDGLASGPELARQAQAAVAAAGSGDPRAVANADRLLSSAWVLYVQTLQTPTAGMTYSDNSLAPRQLSDAQILSRAAAAPSLADHVASISQVNPIYAKLRDAAAQSGASVFDARLAANLQRARALPTSGRYIVVDASSARLFMVDDGAIRDSMKVIVGKASSQTPMLASTIYYATLNPYWNVPADLATKLIAPRVLAQGPKYLKDHHYEVLADMSDDAKVVPASTVDWKGVAAGTVQVRMRQLPGPANSMGKLKFGFANSGGVYLHDSPEKDLFAQNDRNLSNGCVRLEDAARLGRWLNVPSGKLASAAPEQTILLPHAVPVYLTYLTAQADNGQLSFANDVYGRDGALTASNDPRTIGQ